MPQIQAVYHNTDPDSGKVARHIETGHNAGERLSENADLSTEAIRRITPILADLMNQPKAEEWDLYSCAEVQALAKLLEAVPQADYRKITFICPNKQGEAENWSPCVHCQSWLVGVGKWGMGRQYKISEKIIDRLQPKKKDNPYFDLFSRTFFPPLTNAF